MRHHRSIRLGLIGVLFALGLAGCGVDRYNWHFGLGTTADDGVTTDTSVDRLTDGVVPAEPSAPEKPKKGTEKEGTPASEQDGKTKEEADKEPKSP